MKKILFAAAALAAVGYSHGRTETVMVTRKGGKGVVRVNKSDFDADQAGDKTMTIAKATEADTEAGGDAVAGGAMSDVNVTGAHGVVTTAAPSAPDMSSGDGDKSPPMDETKNAAAPAITGAEQLLVLKEGVKNPKFYISDGMGNKITGDKAKLLGIDAAGYDTEEAAKAVQSRTEPSKASGV